MRIWPFSTAARCILGNVGHTLILIELGYAIMQSNILNEEVWLGCLLMDIDMKKPAGQGGPTWLLFAGD